MWNTNVPISTLQYQIWDICFTKLPDRTVQTRNHTFQGKTYSCNKYIESCLQNCLHECLCMHVHNHNRSYNAHVVHVCSIELHKNKSKKTSMSIGFLYGAQTDRGPCCAWNPSTYGRETLRKQYGIYAMVITCSFSNIPVVWNIQTSIIILYQRHSDELHIYLHLCSCVCINISFIITYKIWPA